MNSFNYYWEAYLGGYYGRCGGNMGKISWGPSPLPFLPPVSIHLAPPKAPWAPYHTTILGLLPGLNLGPDLSPVLCSLWAPLALPFGTLGIHFPPLFGVRFPIDFGSDV